LKDIVTWGMLEEIRPRLDKGYDLADSSCSTYTDISADIHNMSLFGPDQLISSPFGLFEYLDPNYKRELDNDPEKLMKFNEWRKFNQIPWFYVEQSAHIWDKVVKFIPGAKNWQQCIVDPMMSVPVAIHAAAKRSVRMFIFGSLIQSMPREEVVSLLLPPDLKDNRYWPEMCGKGGSSEGNPEFVDLDEKSAQKQFDKYRKILGELVDQSEEDNEDNEVNEATIKEQINKAVECVTTIRKHRMFAIEFLRGRRRNYIKYVDSRKITIEDDTVVPSAANPFKVNALDKNILNDNVQFLEKNTDAVSFEKLDEEDQPIRGWTDQDGFCDSSTPKDADRYDVKSDQFYLLEGPRGYAKNQDDCGVCIKKQVTYIDKFRFGQESNVQDGMDVLFEPIQYGDKLKGKVTLRSDVPPFIPFTTAKFNQSELLAQFLSIGSRRNCSYWQPMAMNPGLYTTYFRALGMEKLVDNNSNLAFLNYYTATKEKQFKEDCHELLGFTANYGTYAAAQQVTVPGKGATVLHMSCFDDTTGDGKGDEVPKFGKIIPDDTKAQEVRRLQAKMFGLHQQDKKVEYVRDMILGGSKAMSSNKPLGDFADKGDDAPIERDQTSNQWKKKRGY
jgi:hypothetical protein